MLGNLDTVTLVIVIVALVVSIVLHESMHAFAAHWLGDDTASQQGRISLNPLHHIDPFATIILPLVTLIVFKVPLLAAKPVPFNPHRVKFGEYGAALVGLAGPATNLVLAVLAAGLAHLTFGNVNNNVVQGLVIFAQVNVGLFVFNMVPIPPLDGSRVLFAVAPESVRDFMSQLEQFGIFVIFGLVLAVPAFTGILITINQLILRLLF